MLPHGDARFVDESFSSSFFGEFGTLISMLQNTNAALKVPFGIFKSGSAVRHSVMQV